MKGKLIPESVGECDELSCKYCYYNSPDKNCPDFNTNTIECPTCEAWGRVCIHPELPFFGNECPEPEYDCETCKLTEECKDCKGTGQISNPLCHKPFKHEPMMKDVCALCGGDLKELQESE